MRSVVTSPNYYDGKPHADISIDTELVYQLLVQQYPTLSDRPIQPVESGWDNAIFRLGYDLAARLPRRTAAAHLVEREQTWLPRIADRLSLPVPVPLFSGIAGCCYPWSWSVVPWLAGRTVDLEPLDTSQAAVLASFFQQLHVQAPSNAPSNPYRGIPLRSISKTVHQRLDFLEPTLLGPTISQLRQLWNDAVEAPIDVEATWIHGDLHPRNVLVEDGCISGVIDWGDMAKGDRATDLAAFWMLFPEPRARLMAIERYSELPSIQLSHATLIRAKGWAIHFGSVLLQAGLAGSPPQEAMGRAILSSVVSDRGL